MQPNAVMTVLGPLEPAALGVTDAHQHAWVAPVPGQDPGSPRLDDRHAIAEGLLRYREAGGGSLVDCQPGGCGRDGVALAGLAGDSGVHIVACTGFHLRRYYPPDYWLWRASTKTAASYFTSEIRAGLAESLAAGRPVRAGFIKIACTADLSETPAALLEAAVDAAVETGVTILVHTDQGRAAEQVVARLESYGLPPDRLVLCHVDKRPDFGLHQELAQAGVLLEYDTFFRPKYDPERNVWPLLVRMIEGGLAGSVAIGTDMADLALWREVGPVGLVTTVMSRLQSLGFDAPSVARMIGQNVAARLAHQPGDQGSTVH
jgi:5-phospho-D-xylono-1,4-lactonase